MKFLLAFLALSLYRASGDRQCSGSPCQPEEVCSLLTQCQMITCSNGEDTTTLCATMPQTSNRQGYTKCPQVIDTTTTMTLSTTTTPETRMGSTTTASSGTVSNGTSAANTQGPTTDISANTSKCEVTTRVLGFVVGLLTTVLALVTIGWAWTCWLLKKGAKRNTMLYSKERVYSAHNPTYLQRISLVSNSEQLSQPTGTTTNRGAAINNYNRSLEEEEAATAESQENVYHILENPEGDDVYEVLDKYKQKEEGQDEENMYHILDGPTVTEKEEESEGVATLSSSAITVEGHQTISQTSTSTDEY